MHVRQNLLEHCRGALKHDWIRLTICLGVTAQSFLAAEPVLRIVTDVSPQVLSANVEHALAAADNALAARVRRQLAAALHDRGRAESRAAVQKVLDAHCLLGVAISAEARVQVTTGPAPRWLSFYEGEEALDEYHRALTTYRKIAEHVK